MTHIIFLRVSEAHSCLVYEQEATFFSFDSENAAGLCSAFRVTLNDHVIKLHCWLFKSSCSSGASILWSGARYVGYTIILIFITRPLWTNPTATSSFLLALPAFYSGSGTRHYFALLPVATSPSWHLLITSGIFPCTNLLSLRLIDLFHKLYSCSEDVCRASGTVILAEFMF